MAVSTLPPRQLPPIPPHRRRPGAGCSLPSGSRVVWSAWVLFLAIWVPTSKNPALASQPTSRGTALQAAPPVVFDPNVGAILPTHRVVAYYAVPGAPATGPAYVPSTAMLRRLKAQGAVYLKLDPTHPVALGIDLVVSVPDRFKGKSGTYSHHVDAATIQQYVDFCEKNDLLLFLDLNIGWGRPAHRAHVVLAVPEAAVRRGRHRSGVDVPAAQRAFRQESVQRPGQRSEPDDRGRGRHADEVSRATQDNDDSSVPWRRRRHRQAVRAPASAEIADKRNLVDDKRVDLVIHIDSVGGWPGDIGVKEGAV